MGSSAAPLVLVTGANGLVGSRTCAALVERGARVRAAVRRAGTAPDLDGVEEQVGDFTDPDRAAELASGAEAVVTTVHPMGRDLETQRRVGVVGTRTLAHAAAAAGVERFVHISTAAVYDRSPGVGDVDEWSPLVSDHAGDYAVTKRDTDEAISLVDGLTRVLVRPPAILGPGATSVWNTVRPRAMAADAARRHALPAQTWPWVHVDDLVALVADLASDRIPLSEDGATGPIAGGCTAVNVAAEPASQQDYFEAVGAALGFEPVWGRGAGVDRAPPGRPCGPLGVAPTVDLAAALAELVDGLRHPA